MALTRLDPKSFLWHVWWTSLSEREKSIARPFEAMWYDLFENEGATIPDVQEWLTIECQQVYAGRES